MNSTVVFVYIKTGVNVSIEHSWMETGIFDILRLRNLKSFF